MPDANVRSDPSYYQPSEAQSAVPNAPVITPRANQTMHTQLIIAYPSTGSKGSRMASIRSKNSTVAELGMRSTRQGSGASSIFFPGLTSPHLWRSFRKGLKDSLNRRVAASPSSLSAGANRHREAFSPSDWSARSQCAESNNPAFASHE